jgi:transcriptional regulator with XRE-family HTH domain
MALVASISDKVGDLGSYLREQRENARLSVRQLASLAGVSNPYLSQVERGLRRPSAEVLQQLAKGLRISAEALYVRAGILEDGPRGSVEVAIETDEGLTTRQKSMLLELCAHFRSENARADNLAEAPLEESADPAAEPGPIDTPATTTVTTAAPDAR